MSAPSPQSPCPRRAEPPPGPHGTASRPPTALTIAGSDSGGGAGIQADLKSMSALAVYGISAITALTSQNTQGVQAVLPVPPEAVVSQLTSILDDIPVDATKFGMLTSAETIAAIAEVIAARREYLGHLVLDPVMVATSGDVLLPEQAAQNLRELLLPLVDVLTPNLPEAAKLLDAEVAGDVESMCEQAQQLQRLGPPVVVVKGGHRDGEEITDVIAHPGGVDLLRAARVVIRSTHGTGCSLFAAIAAQYARLSRAGQGHRPALLARSADAVQLLEASPEQGEDLAALRAGRDFLQRALRSGAEQTLSLAPGSGHGPVDHLITVARRSDSRRMD